MSDDEVSVTMHFPDGVVQLDLTAEEAHDLWCRGRAAAHFADDAEPIVTEEGQLGERHVTDAEQARRAQEDDRTDP